MVKVLASALLVLSFSYVVSAQFSDFPVGFAAVPKSKLNGPVRTVLFVEKNGNEISGTKVSTYNQTGQILETLSSNSYSAPRGDPHRPSSLELAIQTIQRSEKHIYSYDKSGRLVRKNRFIDDQYFDYELYQLDEKGRRISSKTFYSDGSPKEVFTMKYSESSREVKVTWQFYRSGKLDRPHGAVLKYDEGERWISRLMDIADDGPVKFEYDRSGNLTKELHCCKYNYWYDFVNKLDKYGNWIEREVISFQKTDAGTNIRRPETKKQFRVISYFGDAINN